MHSAAVGITVLTGGLDLVDVLQQLLALVDDVKREIVHRQGLIGVVLQPLLGQRQVLRVEVAHLARQLLVPRLQVGNDLWRTIEKQVCIDLLGMDLQLLYFFNLFLPMPVKYKKGSFQQCQWRF